MKKFFIFLICLAGSTGLGLYLRPSYPLIGQLNWQDVLTKGYFQSSVKTFFNQGFIDESFWYVFRFTSGGIILGLVLVMFLGGSKAKAKTKKA